MTSHKQQFMVTFGYDGRRFRGVAPQPGQPTAGAALWARLAQATTQWPHAVSFAARTDAGVSARMNIATFRLTKPVPTDPIIEALQTAQPDGLTQVTARTLPTRVMARPMVAAKHYCYRLAGPDATLAPGAPVWQLACDIHIARLRRALAPFRGCHDFTRFCRAARPTGNPRRTIYDITVDTPSQAETSGAAKILAIHIHGDGFLRRMLRMIVFTAVEAACGLRTVRSIPSLLDMHEPRAAARIRMSAPAHGLTLEHLTLTPQAKAVCSQTRPGLPWASG